MLTLNKAIKASQKDLESFNSSDLLQLAKYYNINATQPIKKFTKELAQEILNGHQNEQRTIAQMVGSKEELDAVLKFLKEHGYDNLQDQNGEDTFKEAVKKGNLDVVTFLHNHHVYSHGYIVDMAARYGHMDIVKFLLEAGYPYSVDLLYTAIFNKNPDLVKYFISKGIHGNIVRSMALAAELNVIDILKILVAAFPKKVDPNILDHAASSGSMESVKFLVENGFPSKDAHKLALDYNHFEIAKYLAEHDRAPGFVEACTKMKQDCGSDEDPVSSDDWCEIVPDEYLMKDPPNLSQCMRLKTLIGIIAGQLTARAFGEFEPQWPFDPFTKNKMTRAFLEKLYSKYLEFETDFNRMTYNDSLMASKMRDFVTFMKLSKQSSQLVPSMSEIAFKNIVKGPLKLNDTARPLTDLEQQEMDRLTRLEGESPVVPRPPTATTQRRTNPAAPINLSSLESESESESEVDSERESDAEVSLPVARPIANTLASPVNLPTSEEEESAEEQSDESLSRFNIPENESEEEIEGEDNRLFSHDTNLTRATSGENAAAKEGSAVALSADGKVLAIGGPADNRNLGAVWMFIKNWYGRWIQHEEKLVAAFSDSNAGYGHSVALSADGDTVAVGGPFDNSRGGSTVIFTRTNDGFWHQRGPKLFGTGYTGRSNQGYSVALSADGDTVAVGGHQDNDGVGAVWIFTRSDGLWSQQGSKLVGFGNTGRSNQGYSVALSANGNTLAVGGYEDDGGMGAVWIFTRSTDGRWTQQGRKLVGSSNEGLSGQGSAVALSADGNTLAVGGDKDAEKIGAVWIFTRSFGIWTQQGPKLADDTYFSMQGRSVSLTANGNILAVGGPARLEGRGGTWIYARDSFGRWTQTDLLSKPYYDGEQGASVSISGDGKTLAVGAPGHDSNNGSVTLYFARS